MKLKDYIKQEKDFCATLARTWGVSVGYVSHLVTGRRKVSPARAVEIEKLTQGAVSRKDLRPKDYFIIWPDLKA